MSIKKETPNFIIFTAFLKIPSTIELNAYYDLCVANLDLKKFVILNPLSIYLPAGKSRLCFDIYVYIVNNNVYVVNCNKSDKCRIVCTTCSIFYYRDEFNRLLDAFRNSNKNYEQFCSLMNSNDYRDVFVSLLEITTAPPPAPSADNNDRGVLDGFSIDDDYALVNNAIELQVTPSNVNSTVWWSLKTFNQFTPV